MKKSILLVSIVVISVLTVISNAYTSKHPSRFYIQIAAYKDQKQAGAHVQDLKNLGHDSYYEKTVVPGKGEWYRVYIGRFRDRSAARAAGDELRKMGIIGNFSIQEVSSSRAVPQAVRQKGDRKKTETAAKERRPVKNEPKSASGKTDKKAAIKGQPVEAGGAPAQSAVSSGAPAPDETALPENPVYRSAIADLESGRYNEALSKLNTLTREDIEPGFKEKVLRRIADCHYYLGRGGSNTDLLAAVDAYKELVQKYPDSKKENAHAYYRLARSYDTLKFYYEAKREYLNIYQRYPDSSYFPEAVYMIGEMAFRTRSFEEAAAKFKEYLQKYPKGEYIKKAYFGAGDAYSQLRQDDQAAVVYHDALARWPLDETPKDSILNLAYHYLRSKKYSDAVSAFFLFLNLYPEDELCREVHFSIARAFIEMDQYPIAVKMLSVLIENYPDSREALEGAIVMANIGVKKPGMKFPDLPGIQNYRDPIHAYNIMLARQDTGELTEGLLLQKGYALGKNNRYEEAFDTNVILVRFFPQGRYREEGIRNLIQNVNHLVHKYYDQGDHLAIARIYFKSYEGILTKDEDYKAIYKMGDSLKRLELYFDSKRVFENLLGVAGNIPERNQILLAMAGIDCRRGRHDSAERALDELAAKTPKTDRATYAGIRKLRGDLYMQKGLFDKASSSYSECIEYAEDMDEPAALYFSYAQALKELNSCPAAIAHYQKAVAAYNKDKKKYPQDLLLESFRGIGDCLFKEGKYGEAVAMYKQSLTDVPESRRNLWALYDMGRGYVKSKNPQMAEKTFSELKSRGGEEFWGNIVDYYVKENNWDEKYSKYVQ
ncbi:MAG: tetratricopeptide repeat protein [Syntrophales bacterium]